MEGANYKNKKYYNIKKKKKKDPRGLRPPPESVPTISHSISLSIYVSKKEDSLVSEKGTAIIN